MEIKTLSQDDKKLIFELVGADHTFCNELKEELWNDDSVNAAGYAITHPLIGIPKFTIELKKKASFTNILKKAVERIQAKNKDFSSAIKKVK